MHLLVAADVTQLHASGSLRLTAALLDRFTHRLHVLEHSGESYRFRDSMRRQRSVAS